VQQTGCALLSWDLGAVRDELLLDTTGMIWKSSLDRKLNGASAKFFSLQYTSLPAFQDTQANPGEFIER